MYLRLFNASALPGIGSAVSIQVYGFGCHTMNVRWAIQWWMGWFNGGLVRLLGISFTCENPRLPLLRVVTCYHNREWCWIVTVFYCIYGEVHCSLTKHSPGRLIAVSSSLLPGCSISEDGATLPNEQFEQILQPLSRRQWLIVTCRSNQGKDPGKKMMDSICLD